MAKGLGLRHKEGGGILPQVGSYRKEDYNPPLGGIPPNFSQPSWGALPPKAKGVWAPMLLSGNFQKLPGPFFWDCFGMFRNLPDYFQNLLGQFGMFQSYLDRFRAHPGYS